MDKKVAKRRGRVTSWKGNAWIRFKRGVQPTTRRRGSTGVDILVLRSPDMCVSIYVCMCVSAYGTSPDRYYRGARPCPSACTRLCCVVHAFLCALRNYSTMISLDIFKGKKAYHFPFCKSRKLCIWFFFISYIMLLEKNVDFIPKIFK